jgi:DNA invertase Pin-like site-specific DNA recombinase
MARKFDCLLVWKRDRFDRSLVDWLNRYSHPGEHIIRFIGVTQGLDTDPRNPAFRFLLHMLVRQRSLEVAHPPGVWQA